MDWQITRFTRLDPCSLYRFRFFDSDCNITALLQSTFNKRSCQFPHLSSHFLFGHLLLKNTCLKKHHVTLQPFPTIWHHHLYANLPTQFPNLSPSGVPSMGTRALMGTDSGCSGSVAKVWRSPMPLFVRRERSGDH